MSAEALESFLTKITQRYITIPHVFLDLDVPIALKTTVLVVGKHFFTSKIHAKTIISSAVMI